jgi:thiosulfate reductase cytochrome b subunit
MEGSRMPTRSHRESPPELLVENLHRRDLEVAIYEHPYLVRITHWVSALSVIVMIFSGLQIFRAFPSFGAKLPQQDLTQVPAWLGLGGWLGGALQWHLTFMWPLIAAGVVYIVYQCSFMKPRRPVRIHAGPGWVKKL